MAGSDAKAMVSGWQRILRGQGKSWVVFENGTCVVLMEPRGDLKEQATKLLKEWGPVHVGTPAGDFNVIALPDHAGYVVTSHHPDIMTYLSPDEADEETSEMIVGLIGRAKRDQDAQELKVVHVEDGRT
jgi:hypothetical protein